MAETQRSLGGVGQREAGAYPHTLVIWDYINDHPGVTVDDLKAKALELDWIARGYAHRFYAGELEPGPRNANMRKPRCACYDGGRCGSRSFRHAVRAVVTQALAQMRREERCAGTSEAGYHALRRPRATGQVQARVRPRGRGDGRCRLVRPAASCWRSGSTGSRSPTPGCRSKSGS